MSTLRQFLLLVIAEPVMYNKQKSAQAHPPGEGRGGPDPRFFTDKVQLGSKFVYNKMFYYIVLLAFALRAPQSVCTPRKNQAFYVN